MEGQRANMEQEDFKILQDMANYNALRQTTPDGEEYVVSGAKLRCSEGSDPCWLKLSPDHGVRTEAGQSFIITKDSTRSNVSGFGQCMLGTEPEKCIPELQEWTHVSDSKKIHDGMDEYYAVTKSATSQCNKTGRGIGIVNFETSGQIVMSYFEPSGAMEIEEDIQGTWDSTVKDLFGHIKPSHAGIYNFIIETSEKFNGGVLFLYWPNFYGTSMKLQSTSVIYEHVEVRENVYKIWANLALLKERDYYLEIDCPGIKNYNYKFIGNLDTAKLVQDGTFDEKNIVGAIWNINPQLLDELPLIFSHIKDRGSIPILTMYLDRFYRREIYYQMNVKDNPQKENDEFIGKIISSISYGISLIPILSSVDKVIAAVSYLAGMVPSRVREDIKSALVSNGEYITCKIAVFYYGSTYDRYPDNISNPFSYKVTTEVIDETKYPPYPANPKYSVDLFAEKYVDGCFTLLPCYGKDDRTPEDVEKIINEDLEI